MCWEQSVHGCAAPVHKRWRNRIDIFASRKVRRIAYPLRPRTLARAVFSLPALPILVLVPISLTILVSIARTPWR